MLQEIHNKIVSWVRRKRRIKSLKAKERALGGLRVRLSHRMGRQLRIRKQKGNVIEDLHRSWKIGEIKPPSIGDINTLTFLRERISWTELLRIKGNYWHENIYEAQA